MNSPSMPSAPARWRFDARSRWRLVLVRTWPALVALLAIGGAALVLALAPGDARFAGLPGPAARALAVFAATLALWISGAVPLVATALLVFLGLCAADLGAPATVVTWFARDVVLFLLGAFLLAATLSAAHVADHLALRVVAALGTNPARLRLALFWCAFTASLAMSEHAVMAMLFPLALRIRDALGRPAGSSSYVRGLFFALAWGATIGGIATYLGGGRNPLGMGLLEASGHPPLGFFAFTAYSLPVAIPLGLFAAWLLGRAFPVDLPAIDEARSALARRRRELGRFAIRQWAVSLLVLAAIAGWAGFGYRHIALVAVAAAAVALATRLVRWRDVATHVPWDLLMIYASALALAKGLEATGAHRLLAAAVGPALGLGAWAAIVVLAGIAMLLTEAMSNAAVVSLLVPLAIGLAGPLGLDPVHATVAISLSAGLAFMLPMGSPPLAIAFASGEFAVRQMAWWGALLNLAGLLLLAAAARWVWPLLA